MNFLQAFFFGLLQGLTEFFPVSSSAHLTLLKYLFGLNIENPAIFNLFCHLGTVFSTLFYFRKKILVLLFQTPKKLIFYIAALFPLVLLYPFLNKLVKAYSQDPKYLAPAFLLTSLLLTLAAFSKTKKIKQQKIASGLPNPASANKKELKHNFIDVIFIGLMQALALFPGLSRSGSTIFAGSIRGWKLQDILTFSFLLAIPTVLGGVFLETWQIFQMPTTHPNLTAVSVLKINEIGWGLYLTAFLASFIFGLLGLFLIFSLKNKKRLVYFAVYTFLLGIFSLIYFSQSPIK